MQGRSEVGVFKDGLSSGKLEERRGCVCPFSHTNEAGLPAQVGWTGLGRIHNHLLLLYCLPPGVLPSGYEDYALCARAQAQDRQRMETG